MQKRKQNRLQGYDYKISNNYFVTICVHNRTALLGNISDQKMQLNFLGQIVKKQWLWLAEHFQQVYLDEFVVMPNHLHGIICLTDVGTSCDLSLQPKSKSLSSLIGAFKTTSSKKIHQDGYENFRWQRSFYDHIIRNEYSYQKIREYIYTNPANWDNDFENKTYNPNINIEERDAYYLKIFSG